MKLYDLKSIHKLIDNYVNERNGSAITIKEGVLGYGTMILCYGENAKTFIINEVFINEWSSGHKVTAYNKMPKKYVKLIEQVA